jgi:GxxExxY protein
MSENYPLKELTSKIIGCFYTVYNQLGYGFLEKVYGNALKLELEEIGHKVERQKKILVSYKNRVVGEYYADLIVDDQVILELKAAESLCEEHELQLVNYLKATDIEIGYVLNFGKKPGFSRKIFSNTSQQNLV